jgi:signal transduction histidine kinase
VTLLALLLPPVAGLLLLGGVATLRFRRARRRPPDVLVALLLAVAAGLLAVESSERSSQPDPKRLARGIERSFEALWWGLEEAAEGAARRLSVVEDPGSDPVALFDGLAAEVKGRDGLSLLLIDPDGVAEAWAGEGLLHEIDGAGVPDAGRYYRAGLQAATLAVAHPLELGLRPWRVLAGRTLSTERLPPPHDRLETIHWTVFGERESAPYGLMPLAGSPVGGPWIAVSEREFRDLAQRRPARDLSWRRIAASLVALGLLAQALLAGWGAGGDARGVAAGLGALVAGAIAMDEVSPSRLSVLALAGAFAGLSWLHRAREGPRPLRLHCALVGAVTVGGLALLAFGLQAAEPIDLGSQLVRPVRSVVPRICAFLWTFGCLAWARSPRRGANSHASRWSWGAFGAAVVAAGAVDHAVIAFPALLAGGGLLAGWVGGQKQHPRFPALIIAALLSSLVAGAAWETAFRHRLRSYLEREVLPSLAPPSAEERRALGEALEAAFARLDLRQVALRDPDELEAQDLALAVWSHSPLAVEALLSAVVVESVGGRTSAFSFGLAVNEEDLSLAPGGGEIPPAVFASSGVEGRSILRLDGLPWGRVRYRALVRPGFRRRAVPVRELAEGLLRGGPAALRPDRELLGPARFMAYGEDGTAWLASWSEAPPSRALIPGRSVVELEDGKAWAFASSGEGARQALFLPWLTPLESAERVATQAVGVLLILLAIAALGVLLRWGEAVTALRGALRHYSKRLILVYSAFLLVPFVILNAVAVRVLAERLEGEQRAAGRQGLESASRILGEYVLTLDPGFGLETTLDDALLAWLSRVVRHEVNLYWGSSVYASSLRDLFTAGLLPERLPGEIYSRLALRGAATAARTNRAGDTSYLELYGTVAVPGVPVGRARLVLSLPLLAQEEELAAEIGTLRRRALLLTVVAALLLVAIGTRLARSFTKPLMEVIAGTERIAAGAASTDVQPSEEELATLVRAIDQMAGRIAAGRRELLHEKEVVDRMIDHITSGVVSVDRERRVLMANRVAQRLLSVEVGDRLDELASGRPALRPLAGALEGSIRDGLPRTVRLAGTGTSGEEDEREWTLVWVELAGDREPSALLVVEDVTEVLRGQRLQAWAEMARIIAHEIKNPLTPIRLSAEHMREVRTRRPQEFPAVFERCTDNILAQVAELQLISSEFLTYSRIPRCDPVPGDLVELARGIVEMYRTGPFQGVEVAIEAESKALTAEFDARLLGRALRNLVENAVRASPAGGRVEVSVATAGETARLSVADEGPGVPTENLGRIFEPYFSTHDTGTGLGLPIAQRIAEEHGGTVQARNRHPRGLEVTLAIPLRRHRGSGVGVGGVR